MATSETTEPRKTKRYHSRRASVVDIAVELFSKNGYANTGVADIGEAAGLARGALYYYIGSKEALLAEIHDRVMDPLLAEAAVIADLDVSFEVRLRLLSESLMAQIIHRHDHVWVFLHEYRQLQGEDRERFREKRHSFETAISDVLAVAQEQGRLRLPDLELATLSFLNLHNYTYQWWGRRDDLTVESLAGSYCEIFLNGVLSSAMDQASLAPELVQGREVLRKFRGAVKDA